ncbi:MAG: NifB/NifX family molybdenum-iron cluster-binding protein [Spirochaetales bacterium]|uniref:NifB/NifX family molybdenum-iron cluster-binding protein n=1 Tax=Candidatus Thalassospirochaeta sargassi TaxID=3119039 RepID=A0AAJ1IEA1_9SPIO|nr:NifB/NifX family molybdenum-iron cluster-binding protein [Spirochaetales bacterium]
MKVAIATFDGKVSEHFGKCEGFTFANIDGGDAKDVEYAENPGGHCAVLPDFLASRNVKTMVVGGIGTGAIQNLQSRGISVIGSVSGTVEEVLEALKTDSLEGGAVGCGHNH